MKTRWITAIAVAATFSTAGAVASAQNIAARTIAPTWIMAKSANAPSTAGTQDIVATVASETRFTTLTRLLKQANIIDALKGAGPFTLFAPTDAAFKKLPKNALQNLSHDQLVELLTYHVIPEKIDAMTAMAMTAPTSPPTLDGSTLQITTRNGAIMVNDAKVVQTDIGASNGIIHTVDTVLIPPELKAIRAFSR